MKPLTHPFAVAMPFITRSAAIAALLGATMLAGPLSAARADNAGTPIQLTQAAMPQHQTAAAPAQAQQTRGETVEQRIAILHKALKITPDEDAAWNDVAQSMRENAAAMDKLIAETHVTPPQNMTALDDLNTYSAFAQAHVDGLKNLTESFATLYNTMPDSQKKLADQVFHNFGRKHPASHS